MRAYLGQNFLIDPQVIEAIHRQFAPLSERVAEIGPGHGELTLRLMSQFKNFLVFEKDPALVALLQKQGVKVVGGDFLDWDFGTEGEEISFVGNLPYEAGTRILLRICERAERVPYFFFMLQREVVERLAASPRSRDFGSLSVLVQGQYDVRALDVIGPQAFRPAPKVDSQLVEGRRRGVRHSQARSYLAFIQESFRHKRKTLVNNLKSRGDIATICEGLGLSSKVRAEEIAVDLWPILYKEVVGDG